ncbi:acyl-homoserine-lactone synthase 3 (plasmid) [Rhizobium phaseoli]|uniref:acyl-homoserine-lactone synthase n=1 Tax=Rhizobium phaseoli TaxID=396 RepID=UPI0007EB54CC|nr:acyl-homoserine-lactone synthase [Rhizobium phaseoli]ANL31955.1 acyl-homoserine-lactone synthase 3 [Rhizobium phaseoli]
MIELLDSAERDLRPEIFDEMFRARAAVFRDRLGWDVRVQNGLEIDRYDEEENPIYLVSLNDAGRLTGSLRLLPTTGETMLGNEFASFFDEPVNICSPIAWECTRFCVHPPRNVGEFGSGQQVSSELLIGLCQLALASGIEHIVGLYDHAMTRVYRRIGWCPIPFATSRPQVGKLVVGIWDVSHEALDTMMTCDMKAASVKRAA